jgi:hypothetical protein
MVLNFRNTLDVNRIVSSFARIWVADVREIRLYASPDIELTL